MLNTAAVNELAARKQKLVAECELSRQTLGAEVLALQASFGGIAHTVKSTQTVLRVALLAAPLGALLLTGKRGGWKGLVKAGLVAWRVFRQLKAL